jgi:hypothetical protein
MNCKNLPNGSRYPLVGGTRQRRFDGANFKPRKLLENAQSPTSRVHALLASFAIAERLFLTLEQCPSALLTRIRIVRNIFVSGFHQPVTEHLENIFPL